MNKNKKVLDSFVKYCGKYPEQRFWQALRNWSRFNFIYAGGGDMHSAYPLIKDTFHWGGKNK